ncbi:general transcription factor 3C polypeptide 1 [Myxocyprinus asiaticus]|uniref:general transcription factor 3C polypeptide 1 n=1 Tax=Myxocyprinus asiaticus TaxID=70543 RepID=UPI00222297C0|nr:general transcription factor 3C polypeptide 1 [Myxocyprinus asiaticus]
MISACTVHIQLRQTPKHTLFTQDADAVSALAPSCPPSLPASFTRVYPLAAVDLQPFLDRCGSLLGYAPQDVQAVQEIRDAVEQEAEFGIDRQDLCERFVHLEQHENGRNRTLQQSIQVLIELGCVRKRYIVHQHKTSLFSEPRAPQIKGQSEVSVRDAVNCTLRLARVFPHELNWKKWVQLCLRL